MRGTAEIHSPANVHRERRKSYEIGEITEQDAVNIMNYKSRATALGWLAVAAIILEFAVAVMLAPVFIFGVPVLLACTIAILFAACIAIASHGAFVALFDDKRPLRQIRVMRLILGVLVTGCCILIAPLLLSRVIAIPLPGIFLNLPLGLLALLLPLTAGSSSGLRTIYLRVWDIPIKEVESISTAVSVVEAYKQQWENELAEIGLDNKTQFEFEFDRRSA